MLIKSQYNCNKIIEMDLTVLVELNHDRSKSSQPCKWLHREERVKRDLILLWRGFRLWHQFSDSPACMHLDMYVYVHVPMYV